MSDRTPEPDDPLDTLVRAALDRRADAVDPRALFDRIMATTDGRSSGLRLASPAPPPTKRRPPFVRRALRWAGGLSVAAAASVAVVVLVVASNTAPAQASPEAIVREARQASQAARDRCYLVEVRKQSDLLEQGNPISRPSRMTLLWTRGNEFWLTPINTPQPFAWGRDKDGDYWLALGPKRGVRYQPDEVPPWLRLNGDVLGMEVGRLLDEVLRDFDLTREPPPDGQPATTQVVKATLKADRRHPALRAASIEFDGVTKVVRKLVLDRTRFGQPVATVTYLLVDTAARDDREFELEGHLDAPYEVFARDHDGQRMMMLRRFFGAMMGDGPPPNRPPLGGPGMGPGGGGGGGAGGGPFGGPGGLGGPGNGLTPRGLPKPPMFPPAQPQTPQTPPATLPAARVAAGYEGDERDDGYAGDRRDDLRSPLPRTRGRGLG